MRRELDRRQRSEATRLRAVRELLGLTQEEIALQFAVARSAFAQWESGKNPIPGPARRLLEAYEEELGFEVEPSEAEEALVPTARAGRSVGMVVGTLLATMALGGDRAEQTGVRRSVRRAALRRFVSLVDSMKGLPKKLGQLVFCLEFVLPEEDRSILASLYASGPSTSARAVGQVFLQELGAPPNQLFAKWSPTPLATASIGQVHKAELQTGQAVAVKIQYPGIVDALLADLRNVELIDSLLAPFWRAQERGVLFEEIRARMMEECDYAQEASHQRDFAARFALRSDMKVPAVFDAWSTRRVLVSEWSDGLRFEDFVRSASAAERNRAGEVIWDFYMEAAIRHGAYCIDPHPGNYLFERDEARVVFLDFGAVKQLSPSFVASWKLLMRATIERDLVAFRSTLISLDCVRDLDRFDFEAALRAFLVFFKPWLRDEPFRFDGAHLRRMWEVFGSKNPNVGRISYSSDLAFMGQLSFGVQALLARLGAQISRRSQMLALLYAPGEKLPPPFGEREVRDL